MSEHTPTPWHVGVNPWHIDCEEGEPVAACYEDCRESTSDANAKFIVEACNSHDWLVEELKRLRNELAKSQNEVNKLLESEGE